MSKTQRSRKTRCVAPQALPRTWQRLSNEYPAVAGAYSDLTEAIRATGPLDAATIALVKVAVSVGRGSWRTVHAHAKKALHGGVHPDALRHVALISLPTVGLPAALDALRWIDESISEFDGAPELVRKPRVKRPPR